jgi:DNA-binding protein H-NS
VTRIDTGEIMQVFDSPRYANLLQQMEAVEQQLKEAREQEAPLVIARIKELIQTYGLSPSDLGVVKPRRKKLESHSE